MILKPDAVHRHLVGRILARLEDKGLRVAALKLQWLPRPLVERHYEVHRGKPFYGALVEFMTRGPVVLAVAYTLLVEWVSESNPSEEQGRGW